MTNLPDQATVLAVIDVLTRALGTRIQTLMALAMTFALFCWAMRLQSWLAFAIAGAFGLGVLLPVLFINRSKSNG
jgi:hypothetical protein